MQTQSQKIKTFEETMVQLDEVFTSSASDQAENGNFTVAQELKKLQEIQLNKVFDLQGDVALLRSLRDMPLELQKILKRSIQTKKGKIFQCAEVEDEAQSKKRVRSKNRRRDKSSEKLRDYADINGALDRMQELEA